MLWQQLNAAASSDDIADLAAKYDAAPSSEVDDELAALKAQLWENNSSG